MATQAFLEIIVPEAQDSLSRIILSGTPYYIRFTYNDTEDRWYFGLYDIQRNPIAQAIKIVPGFPLNAFRQAAEMPSGVFVCKSNEDGVGRYDFRDQKARFYWMEVER